MDFRELAEKRFSMRRFSDRKVEREKLENILEVARISPSPENGQPTRILVVEGESGIKAMKGAGLRFVAPLYLVLCYDRTATWKNPFDSEDYGLAEAAVVCAGIMFEAADQGLGSVYLTTYDTAKMESALGIPPFLALVGIFPIGYPAEGSVPGPRHADRKPMEDVVFRETFEGLRPSDARRRGPGGAGEGIRTPEPLWTGS